MVHDDDDNAVPQIQFHFCARLHATAERHVAATTGDYHYKHGFGCIRFGFLNNRTAHKTARTRPRYSQTSSHMTRHNNFVVCLPAKSQNNFLHKLHSCALAWSGSPFSWFCGHSLHINTTTHNHINDTFAQRACADSSGHNAISCEIILILYTVSLGNQRNGSFSITGRKRYASKVKDTKERKNNRRRRRKKTQNNHINSPRNDARQYTRAEAYFHRNEHKQRARARVRTSSRTNKTTTPPPPKQ